MDNKEVQAANDRSAEHDQDCGYCSCCLTCGEMCGEGEDLREALREAESQAQTAPAQE
jgi:hypothetical protein